MTKWKPKAISEQTIVITGASEGISLATAKLAVSRGANVVINSPNAIELHRFVNEIASPKGRVIAVPGDISNYDAILKVKDTALKDFGGIDSWINMASISYDSYLMKCSIEEEKRMFDINFWGTRLSSLIAIDVMVNQGGVVINMGDEVSVSMQPLKGIFFASKAAVKVFTDTLRAELKAKKIPVEVCLIRPAVVDRPEITAEAILKCIVSPKRDVFVGGPARLSAVLDTFFPEVRDVMSESRIKELGQVGNKSNNKNIRTSFRKFLITNKDV
jgi:short-subunit dehydrogenase